jgi:hypothetical protein
VLSVYKPLRLFEAFESHLQPFRVQSCTCWTEGPSKEAILGGNSEQIQCCAGEPQEAKELRTERGTKERAPDMDVEVRESSARQVTLQSSKSPVNTRLDLPGMKDTTSAAAFRDNVQAPKGPSEPEKEALTQTDAAAASKKAGGSVKEDVASSHVGREAPGGMRFKSLGASVRASVHDVGKRAKPRCNFSGVRGADLYITAGGFAKRHTGRLTSLLVKQNRLRPLQLPDSFSFLGCFFLSSPPPLGVWGLSVWGHSCRMIPTWSIS